MKFFRVIGRSIRDALKSVGRNFSLSIASITCVMITLIIVGVALIVTYNVEDATKKLKKDLSIVAFVSNDADEFDIKSVETQIKGIDNVDPDNLAGGEQQRVAIARAIVNDPRVLICDEPTGNLDPARSLEIVELLADINKKEGTTVLMVTHDSVIVNKMKKHVIALRDGHLFKDYKKGEYVDEVL